MLFACPFIGSKGKETSCFGVSYCLEGPAGGVQYLGLARGSQRPGEGACLPEWGAAIGLAGKDVVARKSGGRDVLIWR